MKSVVEPVNPTRVKVAVEVPFTDLEPNIKSAYQKIAGQVTVPGFRKGKVPPMVIDQRFGRDAVLQEAINDALPTLYTDAVREAEISPVGQPDVEITEINDGDELKFTVEVDVRPEITLPEWEGLEVEVDEFEVTDADVDTRMEALRGRFGALVGVERAAGDGDFVMIDLNATKDGEPVEGGQATGVSYQIGSGQMVDGLDDAVTGLSEGDSAKFTTSLLGTHEGEQVDCEVTVTAVKEQELPELDDDFAQLASEFDTLDELRDDLRETAARAKRIEQAVQARDKVLDMLLEKVGDVPLPDGLVSQQIEEHFTDGHGDDEHRAEFEQELRKNLTAQFVLDELVKAEELSVEQDELTGYIIQRAQQSGVDPNQLAQQYVDSGNIPAVMGDVARGKGLALVVEKAVITDTAGNAVDLENLQEDGSIGDPDAEDAEAGSDAASVAPGFEFAELDEDADVVGEAEVASEDKVAGKDAADVGEAETAGESEPAGEAEGAGEAEDADGDEVAGEVGTDADADKVDADEAEADKS